MPRSPVSDAISAALLCDPADKIGGPLRRLTVRMLCRVARRAGGHHATARALGVSSSTVQRWRAVSPELDAAVRGG